MFYFDFKNRLFIVLKSKSNLYAELYINVTCSFEARSSKKVSSKNNILSFLSNFPHISKSLYIL